MKGRLLYPKLWATLRHWEDYPAAIEDDRLARLGALAEYLVSAADPKVNFVCTHNSRRSHLAQVWAWAAHLYYDTRPVGFHSGGTEVTEVNLRVVDALAETGFEITMEGQVGKNPRYMVKAGGRIPPLVLWSKRFDDDASPKQDFAVVTVCSDAEEKCPFVPGATSRIHLPFDDPKAADGTPFEMAAYRDASQRIGRQMLAAVRLGFE